MRAINLVLLSLVAVAVRPSGFFANGEILRAVDQEDADEGNLRRDLQRNGRNRSGKGGKGKGGGSGYSKGTALDDYDFLSDRIVPIPGVNCILLPADLAAKFSKGKKGAHGGLYGSSKSSKGKGGSGRNGRRNRRDMARTRLLERARGNRRLGGKGSSKGGNGNGNRNGNGNGNGNRNNRRNMMNRNRLPYCPPDTGLGDFDNTLLPSFTPLPSSTPLPSITPLPSFTPLPFNDGLGPPLQDPPPRSPTFPLTGPGSGLVTPGIPFPGPGGPGSPAPGAPGSPAPGAAPGGAAPGSTVGPTLAAGAAPPGAAAPGAGAPVAIPPGTDRILVESNLAFGFFAGTTVREPTQAELDGLMEATSMFYTDIVKAAFPNLQSFEAKLVTSAFRQGDPMPIFIEFDANAFFPTGTAPSAGEVFAAMEAANYEDYIQNYVWNGTPGEGGLFFDTQSAMYTARVIA